MTMKRLLASALLVIGLAGSGALLANSEPRQLLARSVSAASPLALSSEERHWLQQRQHLVLGSSRPDYPPLEINVSLHDYEGLSADYAGIIAEQLGTTIEVRRFDSRHEAIAALRDGRIDLLGSSNAFEAADAQLSLSSSYADDLPVIVTREGRSLKNTPDLAGLRLAMVDHYLPASSVRRLYPKAQLSLYRSTLAGLAAVELGEADAYLGDAISTDFAIGKSYQGTLAIGLLELIGDILDISRIESGHVTLQPVPTNLVELVRATVRVFEGNARAKGLHLHSELPAAPVWVLADPLRLKQVLSNLISNAIKFTDSGEVQASLLLPPPTDTDSLAVELSVRDTGIGISPADQARLFNTFVQADGPRARQGAGLGLVISRTLAELMGGTLNLQSVEGLGTKVQVSLQLPACAAPVQADQHDPVLETSSGPLNILVVDDYPANLLLLERQLHTLGHRVTLAENGEIALARWQAARFDLVITDCSMPVMDGHELTRRIRSLEGERGLAACRILGVTANAQAEERARCLASGMDECLFKPIGLRTLKTHLPHAHPRQQPTARRASGFNLGELRHLTQDDEQLTRNLLQQLSQSVSEDLATLRALPADAPGETLRALAHRIKGGAKMLKVRTLVKDCEAIEQAHDQGLPTIDLRLQLQASLETLLDELGDVLSAIAASN